MNRSQQKFTKEKNHIKSDQFNVKVIEFYINVQYVIYLDFNNISHDIVINTVNKLIWLKIQ